MSGWGGNRYDGRRLERRSRPPVMEVLAEGLVQKRKQRSFDYLPLVPETVWVEGECQGRLGFPTNDDNVHSLRAIDQDGLTVVSEPSHRRQLRRS